MSNPTATQINVSDTVQVTQPRNQLIGKTGVVLYTVAVLGAVIYVVEIDGKRKTFWRWQVEVAKNV